MKCWLLALFCTILVCACSTKEPYQVRPHLGEIAKSVSSFPSPVSLGVFRDGRESVELGRVGDRPVLLDGRAEAYLQTLIEDGLRSAGVKFVSLDAPLVEGVLESLSVKTHPSFLATRVEAEAQIRILVYHPRDQLRASGVYSGFSEISRPLISEEMLAEALGLALSSAISQALEDRWGW
jgi:hypothetical protein